MILLGVAPCTAMVFVWSQLVRGDANYTLVQVSINDIIMVFAFAPIAAFLLGITEVVVPWETLLLSVVLYVVTPLARATSRAAPWTARRSQAMRRLEAFTGRVKPLLGHGPASPPWCCCSASRRRRLLGQPLASSC
jgi:ACR3 family arsenite transporter